MLAGHMPSLSRAYTAARLRLMRPVVRARGAALRLLRPRRTAEHNEALDQVPIIVLGCHRSGTSLLRRCLDSHSRIAWPPETLFLEGLAATLEYPDADKGFAGIGLTTEVAAADLRGLIDRWMRQHAAREGKPRWADKSPGVLAYLDGLDRLLGPRVRYVAIVRDGMDVATSLGATEPRWWQLQPYLDAGGDPYLAAGRYWVERNEALHAFLDRHPERSHLLRYTDLVTQPEDTLKAVFASLREAWEPEVLDFNAHAHAPGLEDHHVSTTTRFEDNRGRHRRLPQPLQVQLWDLVRETMLRFGYGDRSYSIV